MNTKKIYLYHLICRFIPETKCHSLKAKMLRWCGAKVGKGCEICSSAKFLGGYNLIIGDNCYIGFEALIFGHSASTIELEDHVKVGSRCIIVTGTHDFDPNGSCIEKDPGTYHNVKICKGSAISTGSIILPGKTVGTMSHVAAGSVVTHDVPSYHRVAGVPARVIKNFLEDPKK
jgi:acetyltransferase-like isoleucine patch superfamily enzyme